MAVEGADPFPAIEGVRGAQGDELVVEGADLKKNFCFMFCIRGKKGVISMMINQHVLIYCSGTNQILCDFGSGSDYTYVTAPASKI